MHNRFTHSPESAAAPSATAAHVVLRSTTPSVLPRLPRLRKQIEFALESETRLEGVGPETAEEVACLLREHRRSEHRRDGGHIALAFLPGL